MPRDVPSEPRSWLLQRRSTLSLRQLQRVFAVLCAPSLLVALTFLWLGYWYILMYSLLELAALWLCLRHQARHADDYDRIDIAPGIILVEQRRAGGRRLILLDPLTTRLLPSPRDTAPLRLTDRNATVILAEFLAPAHRRQLAADLATCLPT